MKRFFTGVVLIAVNALPLVALAAIDTPAKVITAVEGVRDWLFGLLLVLAVVFIIWAAFMFLTSGGDTEKVGKAKQQILYAVVAIVVAFASRGIIDIVQGLL